jgi:hypothetical protein
LGISAFAIVTLVLCGALWALRGRKNRRIWATLVAPFNHVEYPLNRADTAKEAGGWILDNRRARVRKAWVTVNCDGIFVWHFWKRRRYQPFRIDWPELSSIDFQRFKTSNSWGTDDWGHAQLSFRDGRTGITVPWRRNFNDAMPDTIGYTDNPKYYEQDV